MSHQDRIVVVALALSNLCIGLWWLEWPQFIFWLRNSFTNSLARTVTLLIVVCAGIWFGIFVVYRFPVSGDVKLFFQPQGRLAMAGGVPTVDFKSSYMPLFPYVMGIVDAVWSDEHAIGLFFTACLLFSAFLLLRILYRVGYSADIAATLTTVGVLNGATWFLVIGYQQDEALIFLFVVLAVWLTVRANSLSTGITIGLGLLTTKVLFLILGLVLLFQSRRPWRFLLGTVLVTVPTMLLFLNLGFSPAKMVMSESQALNSPSFIALFSAIPLVYATIKTNLWIPYLISGFWCASIAIGFGFVRNKLSDSQDQVRFLAYVLIAAWLGFLMFSPKSLTSYRIPTMVLLPIAIQPLVEKRSWLIALFCIYSTAVGVQYMFYEDWIGEPYAQFIAVHLRNWETFMRLAVVLVIDTVILFSEVVWIICCLQGIKYFHRWDASIRTMIYRSWSKSRIVGEKA